MIQAKIEKMIKRTEHRIERAEERIARITAKHTSIKEGNGKLTEHGGWELGYQQALLATLEDKLDDLHELKECLQEGVQDQSA